MTGRSSNLVRCARCGHTCTADAWRSMPAEQTLTGRDLANCVSAWPADAVVEVRLCAGCGRPVARCRHAA
jgi:hypothetical protein